MIITKDIFKKYLESRHFELGRKVNKDDVTVAHMDLGNKRIIACTLWGAEKGICTLTAKMIWNNKMHCYNSIPCIQFSFYFPIDHKHIDNVLRFMIKWTKYAKNERKQGRMGII